MPINVDEILKAAKIVAEKKEMKLNITCSLKSTIIASVPSFIGGLVLGRVGFLAGSIVGGAISYRCFKNNYKSLAEIIEKNLTESERKEMAEHIINAAKDINKTDLINILMLIKAGTSGQLETVIFTALKSFFKGSTKYSLA